MEEASERNQREQGSGELQEKVIVIAVRSTEGEGGGRRGQSGVTVLLFCQGLRVI